MFFNVFVSLLQFIYIKYSKSHLIIARDFNIDFQLENRYKSQFLGIQNCYNLSAFKLVICIL